MANDSADDSTANGSGGAATGQDSTAVDVRRAVLTPELARDHRSVVLSHLGAADYPRRDYCVQFRESNLAFVSRLLEEEGITAYFDHDGPSERLVLVDDNRDATDSLAMDRYELMRSVQQGAQPEERVAVPVNQAPVLPPMRANAPAAPAAASGWGTAAPAER